MKAKLMYLLVGLTVGLVAGQLMVVSEEAAQPRTFQHPLQFDREIMHVPFARKVQEI